MHEGPLLLSSGHVVFAPAREFDLSTVHDAVAELDFLLEFHPHVAVDLSAVDFVDSSGLSVLVYAHKRATELAGEVVLFGASRRILRLLEITQLEQVFPVYADAESLPPWAQGPPVPSGGAPE